MANNETTVVLTADSSGYVAALDKAVKSNDALRRSVTSSAEVMQAKYQALTDLGEKASEAQKRQAIAQVNSFAMMAATAGKTTQQIALMRAEAAGAGNAVKGFAEQVAKGINSVHGGMAGISREGMIMLHEGLTGNFKRLGGSAMVLAERLNVLKYLFSPLGGLMLAGAGATAAFVYEVYEGYAQIEAFNKAISSTGGYLGLSAAQMAEMSNGLQGAGTSLSTVREAMAQVGNTGAFTGDQLQLATRAALAMASDTGIATDKAAESLARIQDNVMEWVTKYQQAHHTFNAAQIEEIANFVKQGDTASAVKAVMQDLANSHAAIEKDANAHMGSVLTWYHQWEDIIDRVKAKILNIGAPDSMDKQVGDQFARVEAAQAELASAKKQGASADYIRYAQAELATEQQKLQVLRDQQTVVNTTQRAKEQAAKSGDAKVAVDNYLDSDKYATPAQRQALDLKQEDAAFKKATATLDKNSADYQAALKRHYENVAQINEQYAKKSGADKQHQNVLSGEMASLQGRNALIEQATKEHLARLKAAYESGAVDQETYVKQVHDIQAQALDQEISNAQQRAEIAKGKKQLSAAQAANTEYQKLLAERKAIDDQYTDALKKAQQERADAYSKFASGNADKVSRQREGYQLEDDTRYMSPQQKTDYTAQVQLYQNYMQQMQALREKFDFDPKSDKQLEQQEIQNLTDTYNQQQQLLQQHLQEETEIRSSFSDQITLAMVKLGGDGQTAAQTTADAFSKAWQDSTSALNTFLTTGKGNFDQFAAGVLADMAKIALQFAEMQAMQGLLSMFGGSSGAGSAFGSIISAGSSAAVTYAASGGHITGPGTGTSDSVPAMLSNGEYVINAAATKKYRGLLDSINTGNLSHFATGGPVGFVSSDSGGGSSGNSNPVSITVNHNGGGGLTEQDAKALHAVVQAFVDKRMAQKMRGQGGYAYQMKYGQI